MKEKKQEVSCALTKRDLVLKITEDSGIMQQVVSEVVQRTLDGICDALEEGKNVEFREFGVFKILVRKARIGRNPKKPDQTVTIPERKTVKFKPGLRMREICKEMR